MSMVEGIGDEVIQVLGICLILLIVVTSWKSTAIRELPQVRAVFIVERRSQNVFNNDANTTQAPDPDPGRSPPDVTAEASTCRSESSSTDDVNALRLNYFNNLQNRNTTESSTSGAEAGSSSVDEGGTSQETQEPSEHSIRIKLKYLNDEQRIVRGDLKEPLGQFKRRYFQSELSNNKNVLLIFQGRVLREEETLETIGMYDNCVVHCLVKGSRAQESTTHSSSGISSSNSTPADWNLGPALMASLTAIFTTAWFSLWHYPHLFGFFSTILLACLSAIFLFSAAAIYFPHVFQSL